MSSNFQHMQGLVAKCPGKTKFLVWLETEM